MSEQTFEDKLAIQLMECAILVKKGERTNPLVLETLEKLRDFCFPDAQKERRFSNASSATTAGGGTTNNHTKPQAHQNHATGGAGGGPIMKPTLGGVLGKMMGISGDEHHPKKTAEQKAATSQKNAARLKAEIAADGEHPHNQSGGSWLPFGNQSSSNVTEEAPRQQSSTANASPAPVKGRPEFQRPSNAKSALIANGWIEQQRRSKMRTVWKDVLASLVEGRKPGEETTLWIQRQITNSSGVTELEALHQIPVKWLEEVTFIDYSADNRFLLRVYNLNEEFVFRCPKDPAAAENWVVTLRSAKEAALKRRDFVRPAPPPERHQDEKKSAERAASPPQTPAAVNAPTPVTPAPQPTPTPAAAAPVAPEQQLPTAGNKKTSIKELRALAHGAGISTIGMERGELEAVVAALSQPQAAPPQPARAPPQPARAPPQSARAPSQPAKAPEQQPDPAEGRRKQESKAEAERRRRLAEARDREAEEEAKKHAEDEAERKRQEEDHQRLMADRVRSQQEALRKQKEEEERQRLARERQIREEEEMRRRLAAQQAEQQRRQQEENARREQEEYRRRQEVWQQQQAAEEERRRMAEQQEAERRRQQEEAYRRHMHAQQWQQQQQHAQHSAPPSWQQHNQHQQQPPFGFPGYQQQQQQQQQPHPPPAGDNKYAKMAAQKDDNTSTQHVKHAILIHWALQPPLRQGLRRIEDLITSIHTVFPPAFGVPGHDYFSKWAPIVLSDVSDDDKLEKKVKKLRFFLHPDKLPKDLTPDQSFMVRMLWDITSDALEEHKKQKEELNWIHQ